MEHTQVVRAEDGRAVAWGARDQGGGRAKSTRRVAIPEPTSPLPSPHMHAVTYNIYIHTRCY